MNNNDRFNDRFCIFFYLRDRMKKMRGLDDNQTHDFISNK